MVSDVVHLDTTISQRIKHGEKEKDDEDTISVSTASTDNCDGAVVLQDAEDKAPCFQNIEVTNSSDVHFGNKTYYQGPVTIKQILYTNRDGENNKLPQTNGIHHELPHLAINEKVIDSSSLNYGNYNDGYTTDGVHHINGHSKFPNGINHDHFETIRGSDERRISKNQWLLIGGGIFIVILLIITAVTLTLTLKGSNSSTSPIIFDNDDTSDSDYEPVLSPGLHLLDRDEWLAAPALEPLPELKTPVKYVIIHHTKTGQCKTLATCKANLLNIQQYHMNSFGWPDIGYNFVVGGDGYSYEARGWNRVGQHAPGYDNKSIGIALIGTFNNVKPTKPQFAQTQDLIKAGVENKVISEDYKLVGMSQIDPKDNDPGEMVMEEIRKWKNFFEIIS